MEISDLLLSSVLIAGLAMALYFWRSGHIRRRSLDQLDAWNARRAEPGPVAALDRFPKRHRILPLLAALVIAAFVAWVLRLPKPFAFGFALLAGVVGYLLESFWAARQMLLIEGQLADAIDLMAGSLHAGAALLASLEAALREARAPLRVQFQELVGRIRLGDDPLDAFADLSKRVPLETFRLFALSLAVHWETGGSLADTLTSVGRTIRDRIELTRRVRTQGVEVYASVVAVLVISYGVTWVMWSANPESLGTFLASSFGTYLATATICLQAVGILWIARMSEIKF